MNKGNQPVSGRSGAPDGAGDTRRTALPRIRKILRRAWILALCLVVAGVVTIVLFSNKTTWVDSDGVLHEPLFGLVSISCFFLFLAVVLALLDGALTLWNRREALF